MLRKFHSAEEKENSENALERETCVDPTDEYVQTKQRGQNAKEI